jgi:hypothetical protein
VPAPAAARRRLLRALTFAAILLASAGLAHWVAGGMLPGPAVLGGCLVALVGVGLLLARRHRSTRAVAAAAVAGQVGLHLTFSMAMRPAGSMASMLCGTASTPAPAGVVPIHVAAHPLGVGMAVMLAAHAVGGVLTVLMVRSAERTVLMASAVLAAVLRWLAPPLSRTWVVLRAFVAPAPVRGPTSTYLIGSAPRRGPPSLVCS